MEYEDHWSSRYKNGAGVCVAHLINAVDVARLQASSESRVISEHLQNALSANTFSLHNWPLTRGC
jgi:hypothetical protein